MKTEAKHAIENATEFNISETCTVYSVHICQYNVNDIKSLSRLVR